MRNTKQRRAILAALEQAHRPLGPKEVLELAVRSGEASSESVPELSLATVYRNLNAMLEAHLLIAVQVLGQSPRYELAGLDHHHHFLCDRCDRMFDFQGCPDSIAKLAPSGFEVTSHELMLNGLCDECH